MAKTVSDQSDRMQPQYAIGEIMALLDENEQMVRKWLIAAGVDVDPSKTDPEERITYPDYRRLWVSRANRPEGKLLATLLIEESSNWFDRLFRS